MLDTSNSSLFTDLEQLDLVSCRDSDTVHVFYVKSGQKNPNDIISNVVSIHFESKVITVQFESNNYIKVSLYKYAIT